MPTFHSGNGGKMTVGVNDFSVKEWSLNLTALLGEITHSGTSGRQKWQKVVQGGDGTANVFWDSTLIPDVDSTLIEGTVVSGVKLYCGDSGKFYDVDIVVESVGITDNNQSDFVMSAISFKVNAVNARPLT